MGILHSNPARGAAVAAMVALSLAACSHPSTKNSATAKPTASPKASASATEKSTKGKNNGLKNSIKDKAGSRSSNGGNSYSPGSLPAPASPAPSVNGATGTVVTPFGSFSAGPVISPSKPIPYVTVPGNSGNTTFGTPDPVQDTASSSEGHYSTGTEQSTPSSPSLNYGNHTVSDASQPVLPPVVSDGGQSVFPGVDDQSGLPPISIPGSTDLPGVVTPSTPGGEYDGTVPSLPGVPDIPGGNQTGPAAPGGGNGSGDHVTPPAPNVSPAQQARIDAAQKVLSDASAKVVQAKSALAAAQGKSGSAKKNLEQAKSNLNAAKSKQADAIAHLASVQADVDSTSGMVSMRAQYADAVARSQYSKAGQVDWSKVSENERAQITASILSAKINQYRQNMGLPALPSTESLMNFSQEWSTMMATGKSGFGHDRQRLSGYLGDKGNGARVTNINENVAYTNSNNPVSDANYLFSLWRNSPEHNKNMKADDMNAMGTTVAYDKERGVYATMNMVRYDKGNPHEQAKFTDVSEVDSNVAWNTNTNERHQSITPQVSNPVTEKVTTEDLPKNATSSFTVADIQIPVVEQDIKDKEKAAGVDDARAAVEAADSAVTQGEASVVEAENQASQADSEVAEAQGAVSAAEADQAVAQQDLDDVIANPVVEAEVPEPTVESTDVDPAPVVSEEPAVETSGELSSSEAVNDAEPAAGQDDAPAATETAPVETPAPAGPASDVAPQ